MARLGDDGSRGAGAIRLGKTIPGGRGSAKGWPGSSLEPAGECSSTVFQAAMGPALWRLGHVACLSGKETRARPCSEWEKGSPGLGMGGWAKLGLGGGGGAFHLYAEDSAPAILCALRCGETDLFGSLEVSSGSCWVLHHSTLRQAGLSLPTPPSCTPHHLPAVLAGGAPCGWGIAGARGRGLQGWRRGKGCGCTLGRGDPPPQSQDGGSGNTIP